MKKKILLILILVVILVLISVIFGGPGTGQNTKKNIIQKFFTKGSLVVENTYETKIMDISDPYVRFEVKYPYFKNANSDFNQQIENLLNNQIEIIKKESRGNWKARYDTQVEGENIPEIPAKEEDKYYFYSDFTIVQSNEKYISFILLYGGFSGGAHGYDTLNSFNYDIKNQKTIELKELFSDNFDYLSYLSETSRKYLKEQFAVVSDEDRANNSEENINQYLNNIITMINSGTEPKPENFNVFTFTSDKIKIYFAEYQVGPRTFGMPEVEILRK